MLLPDQIASFHQQGYIVLPDAIPAPQLAGLARACDRLMEEEPAWNGGGKFHNLGRGEVLRFLRQRFEHHAEIREVLFGPRITSAACALLGAAPSYMFNEQYVVKGPDGTGSANSAFAWHQDGSYVGFDHRPYLTMWVAIDAATAQNGALRILPRNLSENSALGAYRVDPATNERVCYDGDDEGLLVTARPGTLVVFSSTTMHCSTPNRTTANRRAWLCQYSPEPIIDPVSGRAKHFAIAVDSGALAGVASS